MVAGPNSTCSSKKRRQPKDRARTAALPVTTKVEKAQVRAAVAAPSRGTVADETVAAKRKRERDQSGRRELQQQVQRVLASGRLDHIPQCVWSSKRTAEGLGVEEYIEQEILRKKIKDGRLSSKFWAGLFKDFDFDAGITLPPPDNDDAPCDMMIEALQILRQANEVKASCWALENFLENAPPMSEGRTYGLLRAILPSQQLSFSLAGKAQVAVLKWWARTASQFLGGPREARTHEKNGFVSGMMLAQCSTSDPPE